VWGGIFALPTENRVHRTQYQSDIEMVASEHGKNVLNGVEQVVDLAGGQEPEIKWGQGISPAKPKTERNVLGIGLVFKSWPGGMVGICWVGLNRWLRWQDAGIIKSSRGWIF